VAELLPTVRVTVFDEAHQLNEIGVNFLGQQLSTVQLHELVRDVLATGLQLARGLVDWQNLTAQLEKVARDWRLAAGMHRGSVRLRWSGQHPEGVEPGEWDAALQAVTQALTHLQNGLEMVSELAPDFQRLGDRTRELMQRAALFADTPNPEGVRWAEVSAQLRLIESPLDIAQAFSALTRPVSAAPSADAASGAAPGHDEDVDPDSIEALMAGDPRHAIGDAATPGPAGGVGQRAWIFTSATLGDEPSLRWFTEPCGLSSAEVMQVNSPFDYAQQAALYVPPHLPRPGDPGHASQVAALVLEALAILGGRTLVLTTTLNAMRSIGEQLQAQCEGGVEVLVQGSLTTEELLRAVGARAGIYGLDAVEATYPRTRVDAAGEPLDASKHRYTLTFAPGELPPVNAFWSITMYDGKTQLLVKNPIDRYLINSPMLPGMKKNKDGSLTLHIQKDSPGKDKESNWLPAPDGPMFVVMRLYWPKTDPPSIFPLGKGTWSPPKIVVAQQ
jgi:ATP-dependent DNA helicase DinG